MSNILDYAKLGEQALGVGIRHGSIYNCPYKIGKYKLPSYKHMLNTGKD